MGKGSAGLRPSGFGGAARAGARGGEVSTARWPATASRGAVLALVAVAVGVSLLHADPLPEPARPRYAIQHVGQSVDLATKTVSALAQDGDGLLWIGTPGGLYRYDGATADLFGEADGLPASYVSQLLVGPDGRVWVCTSKGIASREGARFVPLRSSFFVEPTPGSVEAIAFDQEHRLCVATAQGLARLDDATGNHGRLFGPAEGVRSGVQVVGASRAGDVWLGMHGSIGKLDADRVTSTPLPEELQGEDATAVLPDALGGVWVRTHHHIARLDPGSSVLTLVAPDVPSANDFGIPALDRKGRLLVPSVLGLHFQKDGRWLSIGEDQGLASNAVMTVLEDRDGSLWLGLGGAGIDRWPGSERFLGWTKGEGLPDNVVWSIVRDGRKRLWVGTNDGIGIWDDGAAGWRIVREKDGLPGRTIRELACAKDGSVWALAVPGGLCRIDPDRFTPRRVEGADGPFLAAPTAIAAGLDGRIWVEDRDRLLAIKSRDDAGGKSFDAEEILLPPDVEGTTGTLAFSKKGILWTAGRKGISRFDGKGWRTFQQAQGLASGLVEQIAVASDDDVWVSYREALGVSHLSLDGAGAPTVRHVRAAEGLPSDSVFLVGIDGRGNAWAGGDRGAGVIAPDGKITVLDHTAGLLWDDCSASAFLSEADGSIFIGTSRGLARYDAAASSPATPSVDAVLLSVRLGGREVLGTSDPILEGRDRSLLVRLAASTLGRPVRFRYRIAGLDDAFTVTSQREIRYPALPPGRYSLEVAAVGRNAGAPDAFSFAVAAFWWETVWAKVLLMAPFSLLVLGAVKVRTRALEARRRQLEDAVVARSAELAAKNRELEEASFTDPLMGIRNRRFFAAVIGDDVGRVKRAFVDGGVGRNRDLIFYMVDIDNFKEVNDAHGHRAGDQVLVEAAARLQGLLRTTDLLIRWGGEELLIVARDSDRNDGDVLARRILEAFSLPMALPDGQPIKKTCSVGWAPYPWLTGSPQALSYDRVLTLADKALYIAKASGRNNAVGLIPPDEIGDIEDAEPVEHLDGITIRFMRTRGPA